VTEENKKANIAEELGRAEEALGATELLYNGGFYKDAVGKLYYFLLYHVRALLLSKGMEAKSHEGALRLFGLHFVKESVFAPDDSHLFARLMKFREEADYNPASLFTKKHFIELKREAVRLSTSIKRHLRHAGYL